MKIKYLILSLAIIAAGSAFTGCSSNREKINEDTKESVKQANQDVKETQVEIDKDWQQFKSDAQVKINDNEKKIDEFRVDIKAEAQKDGHKIKAKYEKEVNALEEQNTELKKKLSEYKYEGKDKWAEFKTGFNHDMNIVGNKLKDIFSDKD
jgi:hypothetical protein